MTTRSGAPDCKPLLKRKDFSRHWLETIDLQIHPSYSVITPQVRNALLDAAEAAYRRALEDIEKWESTLWCYLAMVLDSMSLILIRHDCVDQKGLGDGHRAWGLLQERLSSNETVTVRNCLVYNWKRMRHFTTISSGHSNCQLGLNRQENICLSHYSMEWYSMVYQRGTNISWCKKASNPLATSLSWGQDSPTMKKAACTEREWKMTIHMFRWYPSMVNPSTRPQAKITNLLSWVTLTLHAIVVVCEDIPKISALREIRLSVLSVKGKAI